MTELSCSEHSVMPGVKDNADAQHRDLHMQLWRTRSSWLRARVSGSEQTSSLQQTCWEHSQRIMDMRKELALEEAEQVRLHAHMVDIRAGIAATGINVNTSYSHSGDQQVWSIREEMDMREILRQANTFLEEARTAEVEWKFQAERIHDVESHIALEHTELCSLQTEEQEEHDLSEQYCEECAVYSSELTTANATIESETISCEQKKLALSEAKKHELAVLSDCKSELERYIQANEELSANMSSRALCLCRRKA